MRGLFFAKAQNADKWAEMRQSLVFALCFLAHPLIICYNFHKNFRRENRTGKETNEAQAKMGPFLFYF
jgi:hypothetical protein